MKSKELIITKEINGEIISLPLSKMNEVEKQISLGIELTEEEQEEKTRQIIEHMEKLVKKFNLKK